MITEKLTDRITLHNGDCLDVLRSLPDNSFELAIVDPPYGLDFGNFNRTNKDANGNRRKANKYIQSDWDKEIPSQEYFDELFRVSKHQIIWGGNYFNLPPTKSFIFWYKHQPVDNFSDGEFAWTSFNKVAKCFDYPYYGNINSEKDRIHSTQKPVALYAWLLNNYAEKGWKILDTHLGSASSAIAAHKLGFEFVGIELNEEYFAKATKRVREHINQLQLF